MFDSIIAKEGQKSVLFAFIAMLVFILGGCGFLAFTAFVLILIFVFVYRNNTLKNHSKQSDIVAPISGTVSAIDVKDNKKHIYIDVSICDTHILRSLEDGEYKVSYQRGLNLVLSTFKAKLLNEKTTVAFENSSMQLISSMCNPKVEINQNSSLQVSERIGSFLQGQVIVTLNSELVPLVKIGDKLQSGITVLSNKISTNEEI
jgi:biotin carboxyl carrier protein